MIKSITFQTDCGRYKLTALIKDKDKYYSQFFEIDNDIIKEVWDNDDYLINVLYPILKSKIDKNNELSDFILKKDFDDIKELFDEAIEFGFFLKNNQYEQR